MQRLFAAAFVILLLGCTAGVEIPREGSVTEVKERTLDRIEKMEKAIAEGNDQGMAFGQDMRRLAGNINRLKGTIRIVKVGTEQDLEALAEAYWQVARLAGGGAERPAHLEAGKPPVVKAGDIGELLPQVRKIVESVPDSNKRPPPKVGR